MTSGTAGLAADGARAVLIGTHSHVSGSQLHDLPSVATTLDDLETALRDVCGLRPEHVHRVPAAADSEEVIGTIERVAREATGVVLLYYVGHGLLGPRDELYLATHGTRSHEEISRAVPYHTVQGLLSACAGGGIVVLDCCYSGRADVPDGSGVPAQEPFVSVRPGGSLLLTATSRYDLSFAPEERRHTLFSGRLLRLLTEGDPAGPPWLTMDNLYSALDRAFAEGPIRPRRQSEGSLGSLLIARNPAYGESGDTSRDGAARRDDPPADVPCPYPGTEYFSAADSRHFFGREELARRLIDTVCAAAPDGAAPMTVVIGASGVGKSSLLRAGLLAGLEQRHSSTARPHDLPWPALLLSAPGEHPLRALADLWARATGRASADVHRALAENGRLPPPKSGRPRCGLLVVDQFEEIFTRCTDPAERARFIEVLVLAGHENADGGEAREERGMRVVLGLRADHYGSCLAHDALVPVLGEHQLPVPPMTDDELRAAIEGPAGVVGLDLEQGLTVRLIQDLRWGQLSSGTDDASAAAVADAESGPPATSAFGTVTASGPTPAVSGPDLDTALPFLAHALRETWRRRSGATLTLAGYQATGGIWHSISTTTERLYQELDTAGQDALRELLLRLVHVTVEGTGAAVRRKVAPDALLDGIPSQQQDLTAAIRDRLAAARLISVDQDGTQLSHESLLRSWSRLHRWIEEDRSVLIARQQLSEIARAWDASGGDPGFHYRGSLLEAALGLMREERLRHRRLPRLDERFVAASNEADRGARAREARRTLRLKQALGAAVFALVLALVGGVLAFQQQGVAKEQRTSATHRALVAEAVARRAADPRLALKIAMAAHGLRATAETRAAVSDTLVQSRLTGSSAYDEKDPLLSPDGRLQVAAQADRVRLVLRSVGDRARTTRLASFSPCAGVARRPAFSRDSRTLAVICDNGVVSLWDITRPGQPRRAGSLRSPDVSGRPGGADFSPDGTLLAVGRYAPPDASQAHGSLVLWDIRDRARPTLLKVRRNVYDSTSVRFAPDGRTLVSSTGIVSFRDDAVNSDSVTHTSGATLWDVSRSAALRRLTRLPRVDEDPSFSRDGRLLVTRRHRTVQIWDVKTPATPRELSSWTAHKDYVTTVEFSPDGRTLATGSADRTIALWDVSDRAHPTESARLNGHTSTVETLRFTADGHSIVSADWDRIIQWDPVGGGLPRAVATLGGKTSLTSAAFTPDGRTLATAGYDQAVTLYDMSVPTGPRRTAAAAMPGFVTDIAISSDGRLLAAGDRLGNVLIWDIRDRARPRKVTDLSRDTDPITSVDFGKGGESVIVSGAETYFSPGRATMWDIREHGRPRAVGTFNDVSTVQAAHFGAKGTLVALPGSSTFLWPADNSYEAVELEDSNGSSAFSPDGRTLATGGSQHDIILWDIEDPRSPGKTAEIPRDQNDFATYVFHPGGNLVAGLDETDGVTLWSVADPTRIHLATTMARHGQEMTDLAFHPGGRYAVTVSGDDNPLTVWDLGRLPGISADLVKTACAVAGGGLTSEEWKQYVPGQPYQDTCDGHLAS
ncbi:WD40 repeat domain-containing protein [Streptomyces atratus]|uniref:WD40 repeat domain-containing protein n=1 Tax=Streptomyces atratus TaxID=1893 RepID=UPI0021A7D29A|nr:WD40 repeat domain-containing protein [Streptomyces atratus]MCT2544744.1 WD40 repeat domain-containing protein [Streptomyces atratus]